MDNSPFCRLSLSVGSCCLVLPRSLQVADNETLVCYFPVQYLMVINCSNLKGITKYSFSSWDNANIAAETVWKRENTAKVSFWTISFLSFLSFFLFVILIIFRSWSSCALLFWLPSLLLVSCFFKFKC